MRLLAVIQRYSGWLGAIAIVGGIGAVGIGQIRTQQITDEQQRLIERVEEVNRASCEFGNDFRGEDLPAAFEQFGRQLGAELGASEQRVNDFTARLRARLAETFPQRDCDP